jgi:hypothetical protein
MLTAEDLKVVLASAPLREAHRLELPQGSLTTLATDPGAFATFYEQWTAQGQPPYVPPAPAQVPTPAAAPAPVMAATPPVPTPPVPTPPVPTPPVPTPSQFGPPPTPLVPAQQFSPYSRDPSSAVAAFAGGSPASPYPSPYSGANYLNSPNAVAPGGLARPGMTMMLWGFGVAIVGIIITAVTWAAAAPGGTFVVAWGAIIFGTIRGIIGAVRVSRGS